jgi:hypothetical protein
VKALLVVESATVLRGVMESSVSAMSPLDPVQTIASIEELVMSV